MYTARQLVELAPALCQDYPGLHILIVGGGGAFEPLNAQAEEVNRKLGRPCVILTGPRTDVNQLVAACGLFVGVSRAALEAFCFCARILGPSPAAGAVYITAQTSRPQRTCLSILPTRPPLLSGRRHRRPFWPPHA